jgi:serine/threonine protein kinase
VEKIFRVLGKPSPDVWPDVVVLPEWKRVQTDFPRLPPTSPEAGLRQAVPGLRPDTAAYDLLVRMVRCYPTVDPALITLPTPLLCELTCVCACVRAFFQCAQLCYDPTRRITAEEALEHPYFKESPLPHLKYDPAFPHKLLSRI